MGPKRSFVLCVAAVLVLGGPAGAQVVHHHRQYLSSRALVSNIIVPQSRVFSVRREGAVRITHVTAAVAVLEQIATTTMDIDLQNPTGSRLEAELVVPVPDRAVVRDFTFQGKGKEPSAELLPKDEAKKIYNAIVSKMRDPALLEFMGTTLIRSSVFPVEAGKTQKVRLVYEHLLPADGNRVDYVLPRTESIEYSVPWDVSVTIKSKRPVSTVYSPSHKLDTTRRGKNVVVARIAKEATREPGAFRLSYLLEGDGVTASLLAYPDPKLGGGYFLLLAGLPAAPPKDAKPIPREVTLVLDRSGSMHGDKIKQVREAALQILGGLDKGEAFNILTYNESVDLFAARPVVKSEKTVAAARKYLEGVTARGGTNLHDALVEALRQKPTKGMLPIVLFLTDGLPTIGQTSEAVIRDIAKKANPHQRRVFTFGVGVDVNTALLERIALETRATSTFVLPKEDVEVKVASVFKRLAGPILSDPKLAAVRSRTFEESDVKAATAEPGKLVAARVKDVLPGKLPDLFIGDQLVVLGKYKGEEPLHFQLKGNYFGRTRTFRFKFALDKATTRNAFVPRLWASRKIGMLIDAIRAFGADAGTSRPDPTRDPRLKELIDEIVRLSKEFGILTEYTAFLAREGTDLSKKAEVLAEVRRNLDERAISARVGLGSVNQEFNRGSYRNQKELNIGNGFYDANMQRVTVANVQQVNDRAFFRRGKQWIDSRLVDKNGAKKPDQVIRFGSPEFKKLVERLSRDGRAGTISLKGQILMEVDQKVLLVK